MEIASYALRIAGGILIAILVLSLLVFGYSKLSDYQKQEDISKKDKQTAEFNKEFESYNKRVVTGYELVSLSNYIEDMNTRYASEEGYTKITATITMKTGAHLQGIDDNGNTISYGKYISSSPRYSYDLCTYTDDIFRKFSNKADRKCV